MRRESRAADGGHRGAVAEAAEGLRGCGRGILSYRVLEGVI